MRVATGLVCDNFHYRITIPKFHLRWIPVERNHGSIALGFFVRGLGGIWGSPLAWWCNFLHCYLIGVVGVVMACVWF